MAEVKVSTTDIVSCGDNILALCKQYDEQINNLFESLEKLNDGAWSGTAADTYVARLRADKAEFVTFGDYLKYYGMNVKKIGESFDKLINKWEDQ